MTISRSVKLSLGILIVIGGAFYLGRTTAPTKIQVETKTDVIKDVITVVKEVKRPDGTVEKETTTQNKTTVTKETAKLTEVAKAQTKINLLTEYDLRTQTPVYGASFEKRIVGGVWAGVSAKTDGTVGVIIGMEF